MSVTDVTREELWAKQHLSCKNIDYAVWERDKSMLRKLSRINGGCSFVVDVYKGCYAYASTGFVDWLGYDRHKIETLEKQGDYLESRIHPHDRSLLEDLQVRLGKFIYNQPLEHRNDYCNVYSFRILNARGNYVRVTWFCRQPNRMLPQMAADGFHRQKMTSATASQPTPDRPS